MPQILVLTVRRSAMCLKTAAIRNCFQIRKLFFSKVVVFLLRSYAYLKKQFTFVLAKLKYRIY